MSELYVIQKWFLEDEAQTRLLGKALGARLRESLLITLRGDLGAGKTALSKGIIATHTGLQTDDVMSPTFNLAIEYDENPLKVIHVDAYRLGQAEALTDLGFDDWLAIDKSAVVLEWPEKVEEVLPERRIEIQLQHHNGGRNCTLLASSNLEELAREVASAFDQSTKDNEFAEAKMLNILVNGAPGRMAQQLCDIVHNAEDLCLQACLCRAESSAREQTLKNLPGFPNSDLVVSNEVNDHVKLDDSVLIDFSTPEACLKRLQWAVENSVPFMCGTTGLNEDEFAQLKSAAMQIPVLYARNTSLGVNAMRHIVRKLAAMLDDDYDVEVVEAHHKWKKDSPSGTALSLVEEVEAGRSANEQRIYGRNGRDLERPRGEIGIHALRMGDVIGEHTVYFTAEGERVQVSHTAHSRQTFARGAIKAARWLSQQSAGYYTMDDLFADSE